MKLMLTQQQRVMAAFAALWHHLLLAAALRCWLAVCWAQRLLAAQQQTVTQVFAQWQLGPGCNLPLWAAPWLLQRQRVRAAATVQ